MRRAGRATKLSTSMEARAYAAELAGTFTLVFIGAGAVAAGVGGLLGAAFAHGLVVLAFSFVCGRRAPHINPAVTFGLFTAGVVKAVHLPACWLAQLSGGLVAALALQLTVGGFTDSLGATVPAPGVSHGQALVLEAILTFMLVTSILVTAVSGRGGDLGLAAIGLTLIFCILMGGPLTGASLNPARTLGPAVFTDTLHLFWIYLVGTFLGAALAGGLYRGLLKGEHT